MVVCICFMFDEIYWGLQIFHRHHKANINPTSPSLFINFIQFFFLLHSRNSRQSGGSICDRESQMCDVCCGVWQKNPQKVKQCFFFSVMLNYELKAGCVIFHFLHIFTQISCKGSSGYRSSLFSFFSSPIIPEASLTLLKRFCNLTFDLCAHIMQILFPGAWPNPKDWRNT